MSYILDAIKKAEDKRTMDQVPTLDSVVAERHQRRGSQVARWLLYGVIGALLAVTVTLYRSTIQETVGEIAGGGVTWIAETWNDLAARFSDDKSADTAGNENSATPVPESAPEPDTASGSTGTATSENDSPDVAGEPANQAVDAPVETEQAMTVTPEQKAILDNISFSVISYSKSTQKRFLMDGSRILREGDTVRGFTILAIHPRAVVLQVNGEPYTLNF